MTKKEKKLNIWTYVGKKKKVVIFTFLLLLFAVLLGRFVTYLNTFLVDNAIIPENYSLLFGVGGALVGLLVIEAVCFFVQNKIFCDIGYEVARDMRDDLFKKILQVPYSYYETHDTAGILARASTYINDVGDFVSKNLVPFLMNILKFVTVFIFMFALNVVLGAIIFGVLCIVVAVFFLINKLSSAKNKDYKKLEIERDAKTMDSIFGLDAITGGSGEEQMLDEFSRVQSEALEKWNKFSKYNELFLPLIEGIWFLGIIAVYVFAFFKMGSVGFELGAVISFIGYITQTNEPIKQTALNYQFFVNIQTAINRIFDILRIDTTAFSVRDQLLENATPKLEVKNLCFKHPYKPVSIQDLSFEIECGEKIAIIGESGVGKTTLACLLARIYAPDSGEILLGGKNIAKIKKGEFERVVSLVRDEAVLFRGTIRENLVTDGEVSEERIEEVLKSLDLYDKVFSQKLGLNNQINENSTLFSQSEKQLFALARVVLKDPKIIIFDSAFNSMSSRQKKKVFNIIQECFADKTCIFFCDPGADLPFECKEIKMKG